MRCCEDCYSNDFFLAGTSRLLLVLATVQLLTFSVHSYYIIEEETRSNNDLADDAESVRDGMSFVTRPRFSSRLDKKRTVDLSDDYLQIRDDINNDLNEKGYVIVRDVTADNENKDNTERRQMELVGRHRGVKWGFFSPQNKRDSAQPDSRTRFGGHVREVASPTPAHQRLLFSRIGKRSDSIPYAGIHRPRFNSMSTSEKREKKNYEIVAVIKEED